MKKVFSLVLFMILTLAVSVTAFAADSDIVASGYCGGEGDGTNLEWVLTEDGTLTISGEGKMKDYDFSKGSDYYLTTAPWGEHKNSLTSLVIGNGVTTIGKNAFSNCSRFTGNLVIPDGVTTIGGGAFFNCFGFDGSLTIGNSVTSIGNSAFYFCSGFNGNLIIPNSVISIGNSSFRKSGFGGNLVIPEGVATIGDYAFYECFGFTGNLTVPNSVTTIGNCAFYSCFNFTGKLSIGNGVTTIGHEAFWNCNGLAGKLIIPKEVKNIGFSAFVSCGINEYQFCGDAPSVISSAGNYPTFDSSDTILYPAGNDAWEIVYGKWNGYTAVSYEPYIATGYCGGEGDGTNLEWTLTGNGVLTISGEGRMADYETISLYGGYDRLLGSTAPWFEYMDSVYFVKKVVMEDGITHIGNCAFYQMHTGDNCFPEIPNTVKSIGSHAFYLMEIAAELTIPEGTEIIGQDAFGANTIYKMIIPATIEEISFDDGGCPIYEFDVSENNAFFSDIDGILFSKDKKTLIQVTPGEKEYFIPEGTEVIGNGAFYSSGRSFVVIPESVKKIESTAFSGFDGELIVEGKLDYIEMWAFVGFSGKSVNIYFLNGSPEAAQIEAFKMGDYYFINLYYLSGTENLWNFDENGLWNGYEVKEYNGYGDINIDFTIDVKDVYLARLIAAKLVVPTEMESSFGDVDGDGKVTAIDANLIRKFCANIITKFPVEG